MDPFNFVPNWPPLGAPGAWPQGFNPQPFGWPAPFPYVPQQTSLQPMQQLQPLPGTPGPSHPFQLNYSPPSLLPSDMAISHSQATPQQMQQPSLFITPPSDSDDTSRLSPPPSLQLQTLQPTPTGRPAAATAADLTPPTLVAEAAKENQPPARAPKRKLISEENEKVAKRPYDPTDPSTNVFCRVGGRLSVVGGQRTYNVTVAEIERRTRAPECVPLSLLGPLLKRGKVKGCGDDLKQLLQSRKIPSSSSSKDSCRSKPPVSTLSALLEEEATQLASDHRELLQAHFPLVHLARLIILQQCPMPVHLTQLAADAAAAQSIMASFSSLLSDLSSSSTIPSPLTEFSLITHGLGIEEVHSLTSLFSRFLQCLAQETQAQFGRIAQYHSHGIVHPMLPEADAVMKADLASMVGHDCQTKFAEVDGRLTLHSRKYTVTKAEIMRRLRAPESLNLSTLGSILRRGKTSNTGSELRDELNRHGIRVDQGRRKAARLTCFTALLEEEALILARDLGDATGRFFPVQMLAAALNSRAGACTSGAINQRRGELAAASRLAGLLSETLSSLRLPTSDRVPNVISEYAHLMRNYSSLTHGYGPDVCVLWLEQFRKVFDNSRELLPLTC